ncbi:hypothetical protein EVAR_45606_1 [Eumeta japonica]|uniref:Uncharacterized protein n=1 Tax=Eumeta variegata TaxID=151549 RepID=A0A4C1WGC1_EUMVA|nr:hypothetical protein EVAR_45606_1 [Eumeta japonica]
MEAREKSASKRAQGYSHQKSGIVTSYISPVRLQSHTVHFATNGPRTGSIKKLWPSRHWPPFAQTNQEEVDALLPLTAARSKQMSTSDQLADIYISQIILLDYIQIE